MSHKSYSFEFIDFKLLEVDFKINKELDLNKEIEINTTLSIRHEWIDKKKLLKAFVRLGFGGTDSPFILSIEGGGLFEFNNSVDPEQIEKIASVNCAAIVFPYIRETVSDFIRRAGFPPIYLPPFNFVEAYKQKVSSSIKK